jgi:signal transduction histidine kinase
MPRLDDKTGCCPMSRSDTGALVWWPAATYHGAAIWSSSCRPGTGNGKSGGRRPVRHRKRFAHSGSAATKWRSKMRPSKRVSTQIRNSITLLQEINAALKLANEDLQQFAYSASHDIQEPLRMVAAYSQLLELDFGGKLGPAGDEYIRRTVQGALRMDNLLNDLRTYIQVSTTNHESIEEIEAGEVLRKAVLNLEVAIKESGASVGNTTLPRVRMRQFQLEQVFQNLIGNAIRFRRHLPRTSKLPPNAQERSGSSRCRTMESV